VILKSQVYQALAKILSQAFVKPLQDTITTSLLQTSVFLSPAASPPALRRPRKVSRSKLSWLRLRKKTLEMKKRRRTITIRKDTQSRSNRLMRTYLLSLRRSFTKTKMATSRFRTSFSI